MLNEKIDRVLRELEKQEKFEQENPDAVPGREKMLAITRDIGLFYNILLRGNNTRKILEIGTSTGYSAIWFAEAIRGRPDTKIITIEAEEEKIQRAKTNFAKTGISELIEIRKGDALDVLLDIANENKHKETFDFVFIDADKERAIQYFDIVFPLLKTGGIIGTDNILQPKRFRESMKPYVEHVRKNPRVRSVTVPIDNGEELSMKLDYSFETKNGESSMSEDEIIGIFNDYKIKEAAQLFEKNL